MNGDRAHTVGTVLLLVVVAPFVVFAVPQVAGASQSYVVVSSSMAPAIGAGDVVIVEDVPASEIDPGDVITFERQAGGGERSGPDRVTHRVVDVTERDGRHYFETKGDANEDPDPQLVPPEDVTGRVMFSIPLVGWVITYAGTTAGTVALVVVPGGLLALSEAWTLYRGTRETDSTDGDETEAGGTEDDETEADGTEDDGMGEVEDG
jgi:signal peptidase